MVKAFNAYNQKLLIAVLSKNGYTPPFCYVIRGMYKNSVVRPIIGKIDTSITFKVEFKQGDSMALFLFLFFMMEFAEKLEKEWTWNGLKKAKLSR